jgi:cold-inducible RNA-binding protein
MPNKLFVGSLSWDTKDDGLRAAFEKFGTITEAKVISDQATGRSRGFGFVTFTDDASAEKAKAALDGTMLDGRAIKVDYPREREGGGRGGGGRDRY